MSMKPSITTTPGAPSDAKTLAQIKQAIWLDTYLSEELGITEQDVLDKDFLCPQRIAARAEHMAIDDGVNHTLVARQDDVIVGYGRVVRERDYDEVVTLYVLPDYQGIGAGSALLEGLLDWSNGREIRLEVVPFNTKAIRFYEKFGFKLGDPIPPGKPTFPSGKHLPCVEMIRKSKV